MSASAPCPSILREAASVPGYPDDKHEMDFDLALNTVVIASIFPRLSFPAHMFVVALVSLEMWQVAGHAIHGCVCVIRFMHASSALEQDRVR
jgi:hypothetical protein